MWWLLPYIDIYDTTHIPAIDIWNHLMIESVQPQTQGFGVGMVFVFVDNGVQNMIKN